MARRLKYTTGREPIELELGGEDFHAPSVIPPVVLGELLETAEKLSAIQGDKSLNEQATVVEIMKLLDEVFSLILKPESVPRFHERLFSRTEPFDLMNELLPAIEGLIGEYTDRPTPPSSPSPTGSSDGGSTSTDGVLLGVSTPSTVLMPVVS